MKDGIILVDKPQGMTSHDVSSAISKKLETKAGHTGTLDKFATGLLIVCVGKATKLSMELMNLPKRYEAVAILGKTTDTLDPTGRVVNVSSEVPSIGKIQSVLQNFRGSLLQVPPLFSAKKIKGKRASDYARHGKTIELQPVNIYIYSIKLIDYSYPFLQFEVSCSSGTYIRALVRDIGDSLGCGAYTNQLRRISIGKYSVDSATPFKLLMNMPVSLIQEKLIQPFVSNQ